MKGEKDVSKNRIEHCWEHRSNHFVARSAKTKMRRVPVRLMATCMEPAGHEGGHVWTPDDQICVGLAVPLEEAS